MAKRCTACLRASFLVCALLFPVGIAAIEESAPGLIERCPAAPNCVSSRDPDPSRYVRPFSFEGKPGRAWQDLHIVLSEEPRTVLLQKTDRIMRAESTSLVFRFVDELAFTLVPEQRVIEIRSAARVGYWDFGVNRRRVERIRARFSALQGRH